MFKNYLKQSIKDIGLSQQKINEVKFVLYWSKNICNQEVEIFLKQVELISDTLSKTYIFTSDIVLDKPKPVFGSFGNSSNFGGFNSSSFGFKFN